MKRPFDVKTIFGLTRPLDLLKIFNPSDAISTAYILLDRKFRSDTTDGLSTFTWKLSTSGQGYNEQGTAITTAPLRNITGIRIIPFRFPRTESAITFSKRISVGIEELNNHAYVTSEDRFKFHFLFTLTESGVGANDPYDLSESTNNSTSFGLCNKIQEINSLTVTFGNPFKKLSLDADRLKATITSSGIQAKLTFTQPHFVSVGDSVVIENFTTSDPVTDSVEIELMNSLTGWEVTAITSTTITIDVDLSGLTGVITTPTSIYLESKRFIIPLEIQFMKD